MFKRKQRGTCSIHGNYDGEACGFCAMGNRLKSLDRAALIQRIEELEATIKRVRGLPKKWRKDELPKVSADEPSIKDAWDDGWVRSQRNCADELEAILRGEETND